MPSRKPPQAFGPHITRRDFLNGVALGVGSTLLGPTAFVQAETPAGFTIPRPSLGPDWYGYGGVGDYRLSHGNTPDVVAAAHRLRDGELPVEPESLGEPERFDLVIVGCGIAGLGAAFEFMKRRKAGQTCLMLDNHPIFGGEAKENEFDVGGVRLLGPQGANGFFVPEAVADPEKATGDPRWYAELGVPHEFTLRDWPAERKPLRFPGDNYEYLVPGMEQLSSVGQLFRRAGGDGEPAWAIDMFARRLENTPLPAASRKALLDWHAAGAARRFASDEEAVRRLDVLSYEQFLTQKLGMGPEGARHADLFLASALGLGSDAVSAYMASQLPMPGLMEPPPPGLRRCSFPGGNSGFARYFVKRLIPAAIAGGDRFEDIENMYAAANRILGNLVKVTPSSKVVGDLALALVGAGADPDDFAENPTRYDIPDSVIGFLEGELGDPPGGWPEPFRTKALQGRSAKPRVTELTPEQESALVTDTRRTLNQLLFLGPTREFEESRELYGNLSVLGTVEFLHGLEQGIEHDAEIEAGKRLLLGISSIGEVDRQGMRTVMCTLNGQFRPVQVRDRSVDAEVKAAEKADPGTPGHVPAPFGGVVTPAVAEGDTVEPGAVVATIEAMKMEANITAPVGGTVQRLAVDGHQQVEGGDLVLVIAG